MNLEEDNGLIVLGTTNETGYTTVGTDPTIVIIDNILKGKLSGRYMVVATEYYVVPLNAAAKANCIGFTSQGSVRLEGFDIENCITKKSGAMLPLKLGDIINFNIPAVDDFQVIIFGSSLGAIPIGCTFSYAASITLKKLS